MLMYPPVEDVKILTSKVYLIIKFIKIYFSGLMKKMYYKIKILYYLNRNLEKDI